MSRVLVLDPLACPFCSMRRHSLDAIADHVERAHPLGPEQEFALEQAESIRLRLAGLHVDEFEQAGGGCCACCSRNARRRYRDGRRSVCCGCLISSRSVEAAA